MASTHKSLRSSTADKRPTTSIADGQIALNTNAASPGLFFKDSAGTDIIKVGPVHVGTTAPNATPATGGSSGNSTGEVWLDTSLTPVGVKIWNGSSWENATPAGSTTVQGLLELATNAETQTGTDTARAVTPAGLQSKVSDSTSTTSSTTIASSTAVKSAYDLANAALPKTGGTITGALEIGTTGSLVFEGATANDFETTVAVTDPTADRTITLPDRSGTVITNADTGTVTSTMIADGTIVDADVNASAAIAGTKISPNFGAQTLVVDTNVLYVDATTNRVGIGTSSAGAKLSIEEKTYIEGGYIRFLDNASSPTGTAMWRPASDTLAFNTTSTERLRIDSSGHVGIGTSSPDDLLHLSGTNSAIGANFTLARNLIRIEDTDTTQAGGQIIGGILFEGNDNDASAAGLQAALTANTNSGTGGGQLRFYTAATSSTLNGSEDPRLLIDGSGNVGIGTTAPGGNLHVQGVAGNAARFYLTDGDATGTGNSFLMVKSGTITTISDRQAGSTLVFGTADTERLRINSSGLVGIGTSSPGTLLHVKAASNLTTDLPFTVQNNADSLRLGIGAYGLSNTVGTSQGSDFYYNVGRDHLFRTDGNTKVVIKEGGNVGIGTTSPNYALDVTLGIGVFEGQGIQWHNGSGSNSAQIYGDASNNLIFSNTSSNAERARIDGAGNVGIGTSSPSSYNSAFRNLVVANTSGFCGITVASATNSEGTLAFADGTTGSQTYRGYFQYNHTGDYLRIGVSGGEVARFDSSGRLLVGTSSNITTVSNGFSSSSYFQLAGSATATANIGAFYFNNNITGAPSFSLSKSRSTTVGQHTSLLSDDRIGSISYSGSDGTSFIEAARITAEVDGTPGVNDMPGRLVFSTTSDGASSPTERLRISSVGELYNVPTWNNTAANSANLFVTSSGNFGRSTSSAKYKTDIETIEDFYSDALLNCRPVWYRSTSKLDNPDYGWWGFIAEEVAEIDPRLVFWKTVDITYDEKGSVVETPCEPEPEGVAYDRFVPHLLNLIKRQQQAIKTLEARVAALEGN